MQHRIERRVDAVTLGVELPFGQAVKHLILDHIDKISRGAGVQGRANKAQGNLLCGFGLFRREDPVVHHFSEYRISGLRGSLGLAFRRGIPVGRANDPGQECRFAKSQLAHILAEKSLGGLSEPANDKAPPVSQVHLVGVKLEDLLLGETLLQEKRHVHFRQLAAPFTPGRKEKSARNLHRDGTGALSLGAAAHIRPSCSQNSNGIETGMVEKTPVFGR